MNDISVVSSAGERIQYFVLDTPHHRYWDEAFLEQNAPFMDDIILTETVRLVKQENFCYEDAQRVIIDKLYDIASRSKKINNTISALKNL